MYNSEINRMELKTAFINLDFTDLLLMVLIGLHYLIDSKIRRYETVKKTPLHTQKSATYCSLYVFTQHS